MLGLLLALWTNPADAQPHKGASVEARVQAGEDLAAWRGVDCSDAESLSAFIVEFPTSPLAELALRELDALGAAAPGAMNPVERNRLESSLERHEQALGREATAIGVAPVQVGAEFVPVSTRLTRPVLELGWTSGMHLYLSGGIQRGRIGLSLRTVASADLPLDVDLTFRISPWQRSLSPYAELIGYGREPGVGAAIGVGQPLRRDFTMNVALETPLLGAALKPTVRVGLVKLF